MSSIRQHAAQLDLDARIVLYDIDLSAFGGGIHRVSPMSNVLGTGRVMRVTEDSDLSGSIRFTLPDAIPDDQFLYFRVMFRTTGMTNEVVQLRCGPTGNAVTVAFKLWNPEDTPSITVTGTGDGTDAEVYTAKITDDYAVCVLKVIGGAWLQDVYIVPHTNIAAGETFDVVSTSLHHGGENGVLRRIDSASDPVAWSNFSGVTREVLIEPQAIGPIKWRGNSYQPRPVNVSGIEVTADGQIPRPKIEMSNVLGFGSQLCRDYNDLVGATVTRWMTYARFLDDGITPDENAYGPVQQFTIDQKVNHDNLVIEWEMASVLDQQGMVLPARQVIRDGCQLSYRVWNGSAFIYSSGGCPYTGGNYFEQNGDATVDPVLDQCSQNSAGCKLRFPTGPIPFGGFPSAGRIRR